MSIYKKNTRKTENPCVPGSIPGEATKQKPLYQ